MSKFLKMLASEVNKINDEVANIHYGGCGAFAVRLYDLLDILGYKPTIIALSETTIEINNIKEWVKYSKDIYNINPKPQHLLVTHIVIKIGRYYLDNRGMFTSPTSFEHCENCSNIEISYATLLLWDKETGWNRRFNRKEIPIIEQKLDEVYNKVNKYLPKSKLKAIFAL